MADEVTDEPGAADGAPEAPDGPPPEAGAPTTPLEASVQQDILEAMNTAEGTEAGGEAAGEQDDAPPPAADQATGE